MKKITKKVIMFQCDICRTEYDKVSDAQECEKKAIEIKKFTKGDQVSNIVARICKKTSKSYTFKGVIVKIIGPMASDYYGHLFQYQVKFKCPQCKEISEARYFAPELKKINR